MSTESKTNLANEAALQRELQAAATDSDTRILARIMAEIAEEKLGRLENFVGNN